MRRSVCLLKAFRFRKRFIDGSLLNDNYMLQEAAFYSAQNTSFEESHCIFKRAMPDGFSWEVTEVYSGFAPYALYHSFDCLRWKHLISAKLRQISQMHILMSKSERIKSVWSSTCHLFPNM